MPYVGGVPPEVTARLSIRIVRAELPARITPALVSPLELQPVSWIVCPPLPLMLNPALPLASVMHPLSSSHSVLLFGIRNPEPPLSAARQRLRIELAAFLICNPAPVLPIECTSSRIMSAACMYT